MPRFWRRKSKSDEEQSPWFVKVKNKSPPPPAYTFQLEPAGIHVLQEMGLESGDSFSPKKFWILWNLGLTYTQNSSDGDDPDIDTFLSENDMEEAGVEELSPEKQVIFIKAILDNHEVDEIEAPGFYRMLRSIEQGSKETRFELLEHITEDTPVSPGPVDGLVGPNYSSSVFGALVCRAFTEYLDNFTQKLSGDFEILGHRDGYSYIIFNQPELDEIQLTGQSEQDEIQLLSDFSLNMPQSYLDKVLPDSSGLNWERTIVEEIHASHLIGASAGTVGQLIFIGLERSKEDNCPYPTQGILFIVPRDILSETETVSII